MLPPFGKTTAQGSVEAFPKSSPFIKLAILPKKIPIGAIQETISANLKKFSYLFFAKIMTDIITPNNPP